MPKPIAKLGRLSTRIQSRFRAARPGSVLILVVALLVLMALIGTAWLSTARIDRFATRQASANTQIDLLIDGVINMVKASLVGDLVASGVARPAVGEYGHYDHGQTDTFLASRAPAVLRDVCPLWTTLELSHAVDTAFLPPDAPAPPDVADGPRPRKYYEGQFVKHPVGGDVHYFVCTQTHIVGPDTPQPGESFVRGSDLEPQNHALPAKWWKRIGIESVPPAIVPQPNANTESETQVYSMTPVWPAVSRLFKTDKFEDLRNTDPDGKSAAFANRTFVIPTYMDFAGDTKFPAFLIYSPNKFPANAAGARGGLIVVPAADTDGDGVADAALVRLSVGTLEGLDYFAAVRVIDNNSAINFNTAYSQVSDFALDNTYTANPIGVGLMGAFKSHVGLMELLNPDNANGTPTPRGAEIKVFNDHRWGGPNRAPAATSAANAAVAFRTIGEAMEIEVSRRPGAPVGQYRRFSNGDALALYVRSGGLRNIDASLTPLERGLELAKVGAPTDPDNADALVEHAPNSGLQPAWVNYKNAPLNASPRSGHPYDMPAGAASWPSFIHRWFDETYNVWGWVETAVTPPGPRKPHNNQAVPSGQRGLILGRDHDDLQDPDQNSMRRSIRPWVVGTNPLADQSPLKLAAGAAPTLGSMTEFPAVLPRASVNSSEFMDLWRAYWCVMAQEWVAPAAGVNANHTPFSEFYRYARGYPDRAGRLEERVDPLLTDATGSSWHNNPYIGMAFFSDYTPAAQHPDNNPATSAQLLAFHPLRMFRSVVRAVHDVDATPWNASTPRMQPHQVLLLRAALAAANTRELRDANDAITPIEVDLPDWSADDSIDIRAFPGDATMAIRVRLYGAERQPYITEVYADNNDAPPLPNPSYPDVPPTANPSGYVAIEFHNPYPIPIDLINCKLATINRQDDSRDDAAGPPNRPTGVNMLYQHSYSALKLTVVDREDAALPAEQQIDLNLALTNMQKDPMDNDYHSPTVIPAGGYLVLENYDSRDVAATPPRHTHAAQYRPPAMRVNPGTATGIPGSQGAIATQPPLLPPHDARVARMNFAYVPRLDKLLNQEVVLVRPLGVEANAVARVAGANVEVLRYADDGAQADTLAADMAPLDSFDLTGLLHPSYGGPRAYAWHYARASSVPAGKSWRFVYPGRYDANKSTAAIQRPRHQGTDEAAEIAAGVPTLGWDPTTVLNPWELDPITPRDEPPSPGFSFGWHTSDTGLNQADATYTNEFTIQISNTGFPGPGAGAGGAYPYGGFARNGDILQVPFIGAYRLKLANQINLAASEVLELNALPMDAAFAEDTDYSNDPAPNTGFADPPGVRREQIGRFCPLPYVDLAVAARGTLNAKTSTGFNAVNDLERRAPETPNFWAGGGLTATFYDLVITRGVNGIGQGRQRTLFETNPAASGQDAGMLRSVAGWTDNLALMPPEGSTYELRRGTYRWATDLFDYLTVHSPRHDYVPDNVAIAGAAAVSNYGALANSTAEITAPVEGLINLNTAPWRVLAAIPWMNHNDDNISFIEAGELTPAGTPAPYPGYIYAIENEVQDNYDVARAIVAFRDAEIAAGADPQNVFQSIFDLYRIPGIMSLVDGAYLAPGIDLDDVQGDLSPAGAGVVDGVRNDFEEQFMFLTRVSNLITTRSDSFTSFILVQGWRGVDQPGQTPELVVQRRRAFVTDRSGVTTAAKDLPIQLFYNE